MFSLTRENRIIFADTDFHTGLSGSPNSLNLLSVKKIISIEEIAENVICIRKYAVCALLFRIAASESFLKKIQTLIPRRKHSTQTQVQRVG